MSILKLRAYIILADYDNYLSMEVLLHNCEAQHYGMLSSLYVTAVVDEQQTIVNISSRWVSVCYGKHSTRVLFFPSPSARGKYFCTVMHTTKFTCKAQIFQACIDIIHQDTCKIHVAIAYMYSCIMYIG